MKKTLHYTATINAPVEKVWKIMLEDATYRQWTTPFGQSYYEGSWDKGSTIKFLGAEGSGMIAVIAENKPYEFLSIEHRGFIMNGVEDTESPKVKAWVPAHENYTFVRHNNGTTEVQIDLDTPTEYEEMFEEAWPKALEKLKALCE